MVLRWSALWIATSLIEGVVDAAKAAGTTLVFGLGPGLVAVIVLSVICILICAVGYSAQNKTPFVIPILVIVGCTTLFFASVTIESPTEATKKEALYNRIAITRSAVAAILIAFTVISCFSVLIMHAVQHRQGYLVGDRIGRRQGQARLF